MNKTQRIMKRLTRSAIAILLLVGSTVHAHEPGAAPKASELGPVRGKTVQISQAQIDLVLAAQPDALKLDPEAKKRTQSEVREVLLQRALLQRGAIEAALHKDARVQLELQASRQLVLANAYSRHLADPQRVTAKEIETEYQLAKSDLNDIEYQMRRLSFVDQTKAQEAVKALNDKTEFEVVKQKLAVLSPEEKSAEWRWIASQRMPGPVLEEVKRLIQNPMAPSQPVRFEGTWYVIQAQAQRPVTLPLKSEVQSEIRNKLAESKIRSWLIQRKKAEGLDTTDEKQVAKEKS